jgi:disulfide bond formation protein DsbB
LSRPEPANLRRLFSGPLDPGRRLVWLGLGGLALGLEVFSYVYFQAHLKLRPCELCVQIRFSMVAVSLGAAVIALGPRRLACQLPGGLIIIWALVQGLVWDIRLEMIYLNAAAPGYALCSPSAVRFPLGLPLERWLPAHFAPLAPCGADGWRLLGLNMAEWLLPVYAFFLIACSGLWWNWGRARFRPKTMS